MSARPRPLRPPKPKPSAAWIETAASELLARILTRLDESKADGARVVPFCRVRDLIPPRGPFSKPSVYRLLAAGKLRGVKVGDCALIEIASVRELLDNAEPWGGK